jgi:hypothetical protein
MITPKQKPGCLPEGCDLDSLITPAQFCMWRQVSESWLKARKHNLPGIVQTSRNDAVIHPRTFLEVSARRKR